MMDPSGELLVMKCHEGVINFAYDEEVGEVPVGFAGDTCIPMEGLCYYSVSRSSSISSTNTNPLTVYNLGLEPR